MSNRKVYLCNNFQFCKEKHTLFESEPFYLRSVFFHETDTVVVLIFSDFTVQQIIMLTRWLKNLIQTNQLILNLRKNIFSLLLMRDKCSTQNQWGV